jgi:acetamidase/formamidase
LRRSPALCIRFAIVATAGWLRRDSPAALRGYFSHELVPALTIDSGDVVSFQTLDSGWGAIEQEAGFSEPCDFIQRDLARDVAHALVGPLAINGARAGMTLEMRINRIRTGRWAGRPGQALARSWTICRVRV